MTLLLIIFVINVLHNNLFLMHIQTVLGEIIIKNFLSFVNFVLPKIMMFFLIQNKSLYNILLV